MSSKAPDRLSPLAADFRAHDPDRYVSTLFAPPACREFLFALYAFDRELSRAQTIVREPMAGLVRLQWWDDVIDGLGQDKAVRNPVVQGLQRAVIEGGLELACLKRAIEGRRQPLEQEGSPDLQAFESYLVDIGGGIASAAAALLSVDDRETLAAASRIGLVRAAWEQLRVLETSAFERRPWLPPVWLDGPGEEASRDAPEAAARQRLADWASAKLADARRENATIARPSLPAFFPSTLAGMRLQDPVRFSRQPKLPTAVPRLLWCWMRRRF